MPKAAATAFMDVHNPYSMTPKQVHDALAGVSEVRPVARRHDGNGWNTQPHECRRAKVRLRTMVGNCEDKRPAEVVAGFEEFGEAIKHIAVAECRISGQEPPGSPP